VDHSLSRALRIGRQECRTRVHGRDVTLSLDRVHAEDLVVLVQIVVWRRTAGEADSRNRRIAASAAPQARLAHVKGSQGMCFFFCAPDSVLIDQLLRNGEYPPSHPCSYVPRKLQQHCSLPRGQLPSFPRRRLQQAHTPEPRVVDKYRLVGKFNTITLISIKTTSSAWVRGLCGGRRYWVRFSIVGRSNPSSDAIQHECLRSTLRSLDVFRIWTLPIGIFAPEVVSWTRQCLCGQCCYSRYAGTVRSSKSGSKY
jgi:hypothetical protein